MKSSNSEKNNPIKQAPLRDPGQSLKEELNDLLGEKVMPWIVVGTFALVLAGLEWYRWALDIPPSPTLFTLIAVFMVGLAVWRGRSALKTVDNLKLGLKGERATGQFLQIELLPRGYMVFHDIVFDNFNIDHVIIGPAGVFSVETKTRRKRQSNPKVTYDGVNVLVDGFAPDRDPVVQAQAGANSLREILARYSGIDTSVRSVVLFPNWYVDKQPRGVETWVLNEKAFPKFIDNEAVKLDQREQRVLAEGLARYVRERDDQ